MHGSDFGRATRYADILNVFVRDFVQFEQRFGARKCRAAEAYANFLTPKISDLLNIGRDDHRKGRLAHLLSQQDNVAAFPNRRHLRTHGKNKMDLIAKERLNGRDGISHGDKLRVQTLALVEAFLQSNEGR